MKDKTGIPVIITAIILLGLFFTGCDKVEEPYTIYYKNTEWKGQKVLLEDYTGHTCVNCPEAAALAHDLKDTYGDRLVIMSVHAGFFAEPVPNPEDPYGYDFRTEEGTELNTFFQVSAIGGNPSGMVNRVVESGNRILSPSAWAGAIEGVIYSVPGILLTVDHEYDEADGKVTLDIEAELNTALEGSFNICAYIIEDSIVNWQKNDNPDIGNVPDIEDYVHMHVLRGSANGTFGDLLFSGPKDQGDIVKKSLEVTLDPEWNHARCSVITFVFDNDSKEIIQVEETPVK